MNTLFAKRTAITALFAACLFACAQGPEPSAAAADHDALIIWMVMPPDAKRPRKESTPHYKAAQPGFHESTTSTLGQPASSFGNNAGSYGVDASSTTISAPSSPTSTNPRAPGDTAPAGSGYNEVANSGLGQSSGSFGGDQGSHGRNAGSFGQDASSVGSNAGSYGQSAGSFGDSLSTVGQPKKENASVTAFRLPLRDGSSMFHSFENSYPSIHVMYGTIYSDELAADLAAASASRTSPDILYTLSGNLRSAGWQHLEDRFGAATVAAAPFLPDGVSPPIPSAEVAVLSHPAHPDAARAFYLWSSDAGIRCMLCTLESHPTKKELEAQKITTVARAAIGSAIGGAAIGTHADTEMASFPAGLGATILHTSSGQILKAGIEQSVADLQINGDLAVALMRVTVSGDGEYGVAHPLVVLRKNSARNNGEAQWKVLQLSFNLSIDQGERALQTLTTETSPPQREERQQGVKAVTLIAPSNDDSRAPQPDLSWDNHGGAGLEVVEWTECSSECKDTHLFFVPDRNDRLRIEANAEFAAAAGIYKWRVWSVGDHGALALSPWRTFRVQP